MAQAWQFYQATVFHCVSTNLRLQERSVLHLPALLQLRPVLLQQDLIGLFGPRPVDNLESKWVSACFRYTFVEDLNIDIIDRQLVKLQQLKKRTRAHPRARPNDDNNKNR